MPILTFTPVWSPFDESRWQSSGPSSFPLPPPSILRLWGVLASQQPLDISPASFGALANVLLPPLLQTETQGEAACWVHHRPHGRCLAHKAPYKSVQ